MNKVYCTFISPLPLTFTVWQLDALHFLIFLFMIHDLFLFTLPLVLFPFLWSEILFWCMCENVIVAIVLRGISRTNVLYLGGSGLFILVDVSEIQLLFCHVASKSEDCKCCCWFRAATDTLSACVLQQHGDHTCLRVFVCWTVYCICLCTVAEATAVNQMSISFISYP